MSIQLQILGGPGEDNAALLRIDSGQAVARLLLDCGDGCLNGLSSGEIQSIDHLLFSHLHMDHLGGFDRFFRARYNRAHLPNVIWGPPETARILHHRFRGWLWNLHQDQRASWIVRDTFPDRIETSRFELSEAFEIRHEEGSVPHDGEILAGEGFTVRAVQLDHGTPCLGYVIRENPRLNVDPARLAALGIPPGPWLRALKESARATHLQTLPEELASLLVKTPGDSAAYLTDFRLSESTMERLAQEIAGVGVLVCESQYLEAERQLAERNYHLTAGQAGELAARAGVDRLILFHISNRYRAPRWLEILEEARTRFPGAQLPPEWRLPG